MIHWLDLGWLRREGGWEFYPWGPFSKPYLLGESNGAELRRRVRAIRGMVLTGVLSTLLLSGMAKAWWPLAAFAIFGTMLEAVGMWSLVRALPRGDKPLGWEAGSAYLARWFGPKLTRVAKWATVTMVALASYLVWLAPKSGASYLLLGLFVGLLYVTNYLEAAQHQN